MSPQTAHLVPRLKSLLAIAQDLRQAAMTGCKPAASSPSAQAGVLTEPPSTFPWRWWLLVPALAVVYIAAARLGLMLALPPEGKVTAVWPPSGIALAALLLLGHRMWPGVWLGAFLANLWDYFNPTSQFPLAAHLMVSSGIATGSTVQALAGNFLIRRWIGPDNPFQRAAHAFTFVGVAMLMCLIAASVGIAGLYLGGFAPAQAGGSIWWMWWLGDLTGVLTVGALLLTWSRPPPFALEPRRLAEAALLLVLSFALAWAIFGILSPGMTLPLPLAYLTLPFLLWATFRFSLHGAAATLFLVIAVAVLGKAHGAGQSAQPTVQASLMLLQVFIGVISVTILVMVAVLNERRAVLDEANRWKVIFTHASWAVAVADPADNTIRMVNSAFAAMHRCTIEELIGKPLAVLFAPEFHSELSKHVRAAHEKGDHLYESVHVRKDGARFPCRTHVTAYKDAHGKVLFWAAAFEDISDIKQAETRLRESEARYRGIVSQSVGGIAETDGTGCFTIVNDRFCEITGYARDELVGRMRMQEMTHPDDLPRNLALVETLAAKGTPFDIEKRYIRKDGSLVWVRNSVSGSRDRAGTLQSLIAVSTDITDRIQAEQALRELNATLEQRVAERTQAVREQEARVQASLHEKEVLLKEIHHRVKNNLQIVSTLLDLQSEHTQDRQAVEMFQESRGRVKSIALIHERLYRSQNLSCVNFAEYIRQLTDDLYRAYKVSDDEIALRVEMTVPALSIDTAIPCGLLLNELLSNCLKHAFARAREGWIRVTLRGDGPSHVLSVADNGVGFPPGLDFRNPTSFGLQLVHTLVEQLHGEIELNRDGGSEFVVTFPATESA